MKQMPPEMQFWKHMEMRRKQGYACALIPLPPENCSEGARFRAYLEMICLPFSLLRVTPPEHRDMALMFSRPFMAQRLHKLAAALTVRQNRHGLFIAATGKGILLTQEGEREIDAARMDATVLNSYSELSLLLSEEGSTLIKIYREHSGMPHSWTDALRVHEFRETLSRYDAPLDIWEARHSRITSIAPVTVCVRTQKNNFAGM